jgi:hypothetical protein
MSAAPRPLLFFLLGMSSGSLLTQLLLLFLES